MQQESGKKLQGREAGGFVGFVNQAPEARSCACSGITAGPQPGIS